MRILKTRKSKIFAVILLLIIGFFVWFFFPERDIDDSDLMPKFIDVPDADNGFSHVNFKISDVYFPSDLLKHETYRKITQGTIWDLEPQLMGWSEVITWDKDVAQEMVEKNTALLDAVSKALKSNLFQMPKCQDILTLLPYLSPWCEIAKIGKIKVRLLLDEGKIEEAFECADMLIRFGCLIMKSANCYISFRVGKTIMEIGYQAFVDLMKNESVKLEDIKHYVQQLSNLELTPDIEAEILKRKYYRYANTFDGISKGSLSFEKIWGLSTLQGNLEMRMFFRLKATKRLFAEMFRIAVKNVYKPYSKRESLQPLIKKWSGAKKFTANYLGKEFAADVAESILHMEKVFHLSRLTCRALPVMIALKCYKLDNGDLPDSLEQLVPDYIKSVPLDPFDEKPIRYSKEKKMIYSIGADLIDSGGANDSKKRRYVDASSLHLAADDPTIMIEF